jgi:RND family efflux transporter MFP subunit
VTLSAGLLTTLVCRNAAGVAPAVSLVDSTLEAALRFADGRAAGAASAQVVALAEGVLQAMFFTKLRIAALVLLVLSALGAGGVLTHQALRADQQPPAKQEDPAAAPPAARKAEPEGIKVRVVKPTPGGLERMTAQPGTVRPYAQQQVYAAVAGYVKEVPVDIGDRVKKGQVLAVIDAPILVKEAEQAAAAVELARGQIREAEARITAAQAELKAAKDLVTQRQNERESAKAALKFRQVQFERIKRLAGTGSVDERLVDEKQEQMHAAQMLDQAAAAALTTAQSDISVKESKVVQARAALSVAQASTEMARFALDKARLQVGFTRLVSSYDGVVTRRTVDVGDYVQTGDPGRRVPLLTVQRTDLVRVVVQVPERDVPVTERGASVDIKLDALRGQQFSAKVSRIGFAEDESTRTMPVEIDVPNPKGLLRPGMHAYAHIHLKASPDALRVPTSCMVGPLGPWSGGIVYVVHDSKTRRTYVDTGHLQAGRVEILAGLKPSDRVVIDPKGLTGDVVPVEVKDAP